MNYDHECRYCGDRFTTEVPSYGGYCNESCRQAKRAEKHAYGVDCHVKRLESAGWVVWHDNGATIDIRPSWNSDASITLVRDLPLDNSVVYGTGTPVPR